MNNIKIFQGINDNRYSLIYHTDANKFIGLLYWYDEIKNIISEYDCVMINSIHVPNDCDYRIGAEFLKQFCDIMTAGNKVIIFDTEELMNVHSIDYIGDIEKILAYSNFINIPIDYMNTCDTYVYLNTKGADLLNLIDISRGVYYD